MRAPEAHCGGTAAHDSPLLMIKSFIHNTEMYVHIKRPKLIHDTAIESLVALMLALFTYYTLIRRAFFLILDSFSMAGL